MDIYNPFSGNLSREPCQEHNWFRCVSLRH